MKKTVAYPTSILSFFPGNKPSKLLPVHMGFVSSYSFEPPLVDIPSLIGHNWVRLLGKLLLKAGWHEVTVFCLHSPPFCLLECGYDGRIISAIFWLWGDSEDQSYEIRLREEQSRNQEPEQCGATNGDLDWLNLDLFYMRKKVMFFQASIILDFYYM